MRILDEAWSVDYDDENNQYILTKEKHLKTFERYSDEIHDPKVNLNYIKNLSDEEIKNILDDIIKSHNDANITHNFDEEYYYDNCLKRPST